MTTTKTTAKKPAPKKAAAKKPPPKKAAPKKQPPSRSTAEGKLDEISVDTIKYDADNRKAVPTKELIDSVRGVGVIQPVLVEITKGDSKYQLIAGERRVRAAIKAGAKTVPAVIYSGLTERERVEIQAIENMHRDDLSTLEIAEQLRRLMSVGAEVAEIATTFGRTQRWVNDRLQLLELPKDQQKLIANGGWSVDRGKAALTLLDLPASAMNKYTQIRRTYRTWAKEAAEIVKHHETTINIKAKKAEMKKKGLTVIGAAPLSSFTPWNHTQPLDARALKVNMRDHKKEPCHSYSVWRRPHWNGGGMDHGHVCTDWSRHSPQGESELKSDVVKDAKPNSSANSNWTDDERDQHLADRAAGKKERLQRALTITDPSLWLDAIIDMYFAIAIEDLSHADVEMLTGEALPLHDVDPNLPWSERNDLMGKNNAIANAAFLAWVSSDDKRRATVAFMQIAMRLERRLVSPHYITPQTKEDLQLNEGESIQVMAFAKLLAATGWEPSGEAEAAVLVATSTLAEIEAGRRS